MLLTAMTTGRFVSTFGSLAAPVVVVVAEVGVYALPRGKLHAYTAADVGMDALLLALSREWIDDVVESQREGREVLRQGIGDWRQAMERVQENAPAFLRRGAWNRRNNEKQPEPTAKQ